MGCNFLTIPFHVCTWIWWMHLWLTNFSVGCVRNDLANSTELCLRGKITRQLKRDLSFLYKWTSSRWTKKKNKQNETKNFSLTLFVRTKYIYIYRTKLPLCQIRVIYSQRYQTIRTLTNILLLLCLFGRLVYTLLKYKNTSLKSI